MAGLLKGYSRPVDTAMLVNAFHAKNVTVQMDTWFEYVRSKANVSDLPSRGALIELLALMQRMSLLSITSIIPASMPDIRSWHSAASAWTARGNISAEALGMSPLATLRARWSHMVTDVSADKKAVSSGNAVYVGRNAIYGKTTFGNWAARVVRTKSPTDLAAEHERCVCEYATYLFAEEKVNLRMTVRLELKGRRLACHCAARGLPCHAEVLAALANCTPGEATKMAEEARRNSTAAAPSDAATVRQCGWCALWVAGMKGCSRCGETFYCCREHQLLDWPSHKLTCTALAHGAGTSAGNGRAHCHRFEHECECFRCMEDADGDGTPALMCSCGMHLCPDCGMYQGRPRRDYY